MNMEPKSRRTFFSLAASCLGLAGCGSGMAMARSSDSGAVPGDFLTFPPYQGQRSVGVFQPFPNSPGKISVMPVRIERSIKLTQGTISVSAAGTPGTFYYFGIYSSAKSLLAWMRFPIDAGGFISAQLNQPLLLTSNMYRFCVACDDSATVGQGQNYLFDSDLMNMLPGGGAGANFIDAGEMPATLGNITEPWPFSAPYICLF